jgi:hypothetical protein
MRSRLTIRYRSAALGLSVVGMLAASAVPVAAHLVDHSPGASKSGAITLSATGSGGSVAGFRAPSGFDPTAGYPATTPPGSTASNEAFAGLIHATSNTTPPVQLTAYCIDLTTSTWIGLSYELGSWSASSVPNVGYVARILNGYFPVTNQPAGAADDNARAAAVQSAIWFFTDRFVLDAADPVHDLTAAIVDDVLAAGVLPEPTLPLAIAGPSSATSGQAAGPFTITTNAAEVVVHVTGGSLFSDATASTPIANGATIPASTKLWLVSDSPGSATITVSATIVAPSGRVLLYSAADLANPNPADAQRLILAGDARVTSTASITVDVDPAATPQPSGEVAPATKAPSLPATDTATGPPPSITLPLAVAVLAASAAASFGLTERRRRRR